MSFSVESFGGVRAVIYEPWRERGIAHGFTLIPADFGVNGLERSERELRAAFGGERLALLHQVHGGVCRELSHRELGNVPLEGDAFAWRLEDSFRGIFGVKAADCVPILGYADGYRFAIHAGWRGLARGVIGGVLQREGASRCEWVIGPCAGPEGYEVGPEVIAAIGAAAVVRDTTTGKFELDLGRTAEKLIQLAVPDARVAVAGMNTMLDERFHSHRRDGASAGRGLGFFAV